MKILLIDDDPAIKYLTRIILTQKHQECSIADVSNGEEAIALITSGLILPDIILLDWEMPKMNGLEFLQTYSALNLHRNDVLLYILTTTVDDYLTDCVTNFSVVKGLFEKPLNGDHMAQIISDLAIGAG